MLEKFQMSVLDWEQFLNGFTKERYHVNEENGKYSLVRVQPWGGSKVIAYDMTDEQMKSWINAHLIVTLDVG